MTQPANDCLSSDERRTLDIIERAASNRKACPTNVELAASTGFKSAASAAKLLQGLEAKNRITVERFGSSRRVTVIASGQSTAVTGSGKPHWSTIGVKRSPNRVHPGSRDPGRAGRAALGQVDRRLREVSATEPTALLPAPPPPIVEPNDPRLPATSREPCPRCGVPGFRGCQHFAPFIPLELP